MLIGSERASILSSLEPTTSVVIDAMVFKTPMGIFTIIGSSFVILASAMIAIFDSIKKRED